MVNNNKFTLVGETCMFFGGHMVLKVIRIFFKTITKVLDGMTGITKNLFFFHLRACERRITSVEM